MKTNENLTAVNNSLERTNPRSLADARPLRVAAQLGRSVRRLRMSMEPEPKGIGEALKRRSNVLLAQRRAAEALEVFEELIKSSPGWPVGYDGAARALEQLGRYEDVLERFHQLALGLRYPRLLRTVADSARVLEARGQHSLKPIVIALYEAYVEFGADASPYTWLGRLYREVGRVDESIASFRRAWDLEPRNANAYKALLDGLRGQGLATEVEEMKNLWK